MSILDITVAKVAAIISAGVTIIQFTFGLALVIILVYLMQNNNTPSTWSVFVRSLHYSSWPAILSTDVSNTTHADKPVKRIDLLTTILMVLSTITGIITPLGLLPTFRQDASDLQLYPIPDNLLLSFPVTPRDNYNYTEGRICAGSLLQGVACPGQTLVNVTGQQYMQTNLEIPQNITTTFTSTNYTNPFDMQYRQFILSNNQYNSSGLFSKPRIGISNSVVLTNKLYAVKGLIIDTTDSPGIGIGDIKVPKIPYGATWSQEMLWVEPVTTCLDLNFTLNYQLDATAQILSTFSSAKLNISLTDKGGLRNVNLTYPVIGRNGQEVTMNDRANKLAIFTLVYLMSQWNITKANTSPGKVWPITQTGQIQAHQIGFYSPNDVASLLPFNSTIKNGTDNFGPLCAGFFGGDQSNITNTAVQCGILVGAPSRTDGGDNNINEAYSSWEQPLYSCASTVRAKIQTLTVSFNSSTANASLTLPDLTLTRQDTNRSLLWGVEATGLLIGGVDPYWGPVAEQYQNDSSLYTIQAENFYLPAGKSLVFGGDTACHASSLPIYALGQSMTTKSNTFNFDYSGVSNAAMLQLWQNLSSSATTAGRISNLIWTDIAANNMFSNISVQSTLVMKNVPSVGYNLLYAIPAFITLVLWLAVVICAIVFFAIDRVSIHTIRQALYHTSLGRVVINITTFSSNYALDTKEWVARESDNPIGLSTTAKDQADHIRFQVVPETSSLWRVLNLSKPTKLKNESQTQISDPMELYPLDNDSAKTPLSPGISKPNEIAVFK
jgi:hypothetical protein